MERRKTSGKAGGDGHTNGLANRDEGGKTADAGNQKEISLGGRAWAGYKRRERLRRGECTVRKRLLEKKENGGEFRLKQKVA